MGWTAPQPEINNYTIEEGINHPGSTGGYYNPWFNEETMAWTCNQRDDCAGFIFNKPVGHGGWTFSYSGMKPGVSDSRYRSWRKKSTSWRKADNPDTNVEGVLPKDQTQSKIQALGWKDYTDYSLGIGLGCCAASSWGPRAQSGYPQCNNMNSYKIPLGFKWMITNDFIEMGTTVEGYWNRPDNGWTGQAYDLDRPDNHGMMDKDDCALIQNIGFDVEANWDSMVSKLVHPADAFKIKGNWCKKPENIDNAKCASFYATPEAKAAGYNYDIDKFYICKADPNWFNSQSCRTAFNNAVKGTDQSLRQQAKDSIAAYCNTPAGESQVDGLCGCANVMKYASQCLTTKAGIPGCRELKATVGDLPGGAQVAFADKFCASDVCVTQALGNAALLPDYTPGKQCPNIAQCVQDFRNASFQGSQIDASCKNTINITGVAPPAPAAAPVAPAPAPAPAPAASTPAAAASTPAAAASTPAAASPTPAAAGKTDFMSTYLDTPGKQYAAMGFIFVLFMCCLYFMFGRSSQPQMDPMMLAMLAR